MDVFNSPVSSTDYLSLLTTQLKNQDPIDPVDQQALTSDLTQFSILEGIQDLNGTFEQLVQLQEVSLGLSMVGKTIEYIDPASNDLKKGVVSEVFTTDDAIKIVVDGQSINIEAIVSASQNQS